MNWHAVARERIDGPVMTGVAASVVTVTAVYACVTATPLTLVQLGSTVLLAPAAVPAIGWTALFAPGVLVGALLGRVTRSGAGVSRRTLLVWTASVPVVASLFVFAVLPVALVTAPTETVLPTLHVGVTFVHFLLVLTVAAGLGGLVGYRAGCALR